MADPTKYRCESQGHVYAASAVLSPDQRCSIDRSRLIPEGGSAPSSTPSPRAAAGPAPGPGMGLRAVRGLRATFGDTVVTVRPGGREMLGRDPEYCHYTDYFGRHDQVSRRHAELGLEADGRAWIRDCYSTNLTRVNTEPLDPGQQQDLGHGDVVRLCGGVSGTIELIREDSDGH